MITDNLTWKEEPATKGTVRVTASQEFVVYVEDSPEAINAGKEAILALITERSPQEAKFELVQTLSQQHRKLCRASSNIEAIGNAFEEVIEETARTIKALKEARQLKDMP